MLTGLVGIMIALTGCDGGGEPISAEKQEAIKNKTGAKADYKGPSKEDQEKMGQAIAEYNEKQKGKKVEFTSGN